MGPLEQYYNQRCVDEVFWGNYESAAKWAKRARIARAIEYKKFGLSAEKRWIAVAEYAQS